MTGGPLLFGLLALLVAGAWWVQRRQVRDVLEGRRPVVDDEVLDRILGEGRVEFGEEPEEPLDEEAAREAEDRFWEEDWDEPEEFRP